MYEKSASTNFFPGQNVNCLDYLRFTEYLTLKKLLLNCSKTSNVTD